MPKLTDILNERKKEYHEKINDSRKEYERRMKQYEKELDDAYKSENISRIEKVEETIDNALGLEKKLSSNPKKSKLTKKLTKEEYYELRDSGLSPQKIREKVEKGEYQVKSLKSIGGLESNYQQNQKQDKRPRLTRYKFMKERREGTEIKDIREKYRVDNTKQLGAWEREHKRDIRERISKKKYDKAPEILENYSQYEELRDNGWTNEQIKEVYDINLTGWAGSYAAKQKRK
jgi:hypothetical protein